MKCPECAKNGQESMTFPANNIGLSPEFAPFFDEHGRKIEIKQVALFYGCVYGHIFKLADTNFRAEIPIDTEKMPAVQTELRVPGQP